MSAMKIVDDAVVFLKSLILGDFVEEQPVSAQIVGGVIALIPVVQQVMNARDVSGVLFRINRKGGFAKATRDDYMSLGFAALAVIPEAGSVFKMVFKPLWKERRLAGAALRTGMEMIERMLGMAKGGAVKWIKALEWGSLTEQAITGVTAALEAMEEMLVFLCEPHWWIPKELAEIAEDALVGVRAMKGNIAEPLTQGVEAIHGFVNDLLGEDGAALAMAVALGVSSHTTKPHGKAEKVAASHVKKERAAPQEPLLHPAKPEPPAEHAKVGAEPIQDVDIGAPNTQTKSEKKSRKDFPSVTRTIQGIVGEHIADYHCIEGKGWGNGWRSHDDGHAGKWEVDPLSDLMTCGKLNDGTYPVKLALQGPRGRGIDGLWRKKATGPQKYAVVEAKCYMNPAHSLGGMLADVFDKDEHATYRSDLRAAKNSEKRQRGRRSTQAPAGTTTAAKPEKPEKNVMQMSHVWIEQRVREIRDPALKSDILTSGLSNQVNYSRHVFLASIPDVLGHYEAIEKAVADAALPAAEEHRRHTVTIEFGETQIAAEELKRKSARQTNAAATI